MYDNPYNEDIDDWDMRFMKILTSRSISYIEELAGDYEDLKDVARLMKEYSEDTSNLIYYDKDAMEESNRITDLKLAKEEGLISITEPYLSNLILDKDKLLKENYIAPGNYLIYSIIIALIIMFNHRTNIKRLFAGTENKISFGKIEQK